MDFALSTQFTGNELSMRVVPSFAAPELCQGQKHDGPNTDIWSLGVVLYEMLAGTLPFVEKKLQGAMPAGTGWENPVPFSFLLK